MGLIIFIIFIGVIFLIYEIFIKDKQFAEYGIDMSKAVNIKKYIHGHPDIDSVKERILLHRNEKNIEIYQEMGVMKPELLGVIPTYSIKSINVEDATTVEKRLTLTRMALVGLFAFALKKKEKKNLAYLVINWNDGRFDFETFFETDNNNAMQEMNTVKNQLIKIVR